MLRNIHAGETFLVWDGPVPAATITIDRSPRPDLWNQAELARPALYAHKLTVERAYAGTGLGAELLDWAGTKGASTPGGPGCLNPRAPTDSVRDSLPSHGSCRPDRQNHKTHAQWAKALGCWRVMRCQHALALLKDRSRLNFSRSQRTR